GTSQSPAQDVQPRLGCCREFEVCIGAYVLQYRANFETGTLTPSKARYATFVEHGSATASVFEKANGFGPNVLRRSRKNPRNATRVFVALGLTERGRGTVGELNVPVVGTGAVHVVLDAARPIAQDRQRDPERKGHDGGAGQNSQ